MKALRILTVFMLVLCKLSLADQSSLQQPLHIYVSSSHLGDERGTVELPFASLTAARNHIRTTKRLRKASTSPIEIRILGGVYSLDEPFQLESKDSGGMDSEIVYRSWGNERAIITGAECLAAKASSAVTDESILSTLPTGAKNHIRSIDIDPRTAVDLGNPRLRGTSIPSDLGPSDLLINWTALSPSVWPADFWLKGNTTTPDQSDSISIELDHNFRSSLNDSTSIFGFPGNEWAYLYIPGKNINISQDRVVAALPNEWKYGLRFPSRWRLMNAIVGLDRPGKYFVDRTNNRVIFWPKTSKNLLVCITKSTYPLIVLKGAKHIRFQDIDFIGTRTDGLVVENSSHITFSNVSVRSTGRKGIVIRGGANNTIMQSTISQTGEDGILLSSGDRKKLIPSNHTVIDSIISEFGNWSISYSPGIKLHGVGIRISNNIIRSGPHAGIIFSGNNHTIEMNEISHVARDTGDVGAIYAGRDITMHGTVIRRNYIHDVTSKHPGGAIGIYLDDLYSGTSIEDNIVANTDKGVLIGGGRHNRVSGNYFMQCRTSIHTDARGKHEKANLIKRAAPGSSWDIRSKLDIVTKHKSTYMRQYPELSDITDKDYLTPEGNLIENNYYQCGMKFHSSRISLPDTWFRLSNNNCISISSNGAASGTDTPDNYPISFLVEYSEAARAILRSVGPRQQRLN